MLTSWALGVDLNIINPDFEKLYRLLKGKALGLVAVLSDIIPVASMLAVADD